MTALLPPKRRGVAGLGAGDLVLLAGCVALPAGAAMIYMPAGVLVLGLELVVVGLWWES